MEKRRNKKSTSQQTFRGGMWVPVLQFKRAIREGYSNMDHAMAKGEESKKA